LAKTGDTKAAVAAYDRVAGNSGIDPEFRDLAELLSVLHGLPDGDPKAAVERLQKLTQSGNPWRATALDLTAAAKLKAGDPGGAGSKPRLAGARRQPGARDEPSGLAGNAGARLGHQRWRGLLALYQGDVAAGDRRRSVLRDGWRRSGHRP